MAAMLYTFIDTNIYVRSMTQVGSRAIFEKFSFLAKRGILNLLVPEIVRCEVENEIKKLPDGFRKGFESLIEFNIKRKIWSEMRDVKSSITSHLNSKQDEKFLNFKLTSDDIVQLFDSPMVCNIPLNDEIKLNTQKRKFRMPKPASGKFEFDNDSAIIESLVYYFSKLVDANPILLFCSENHTDFAIEKQCPSQGREFILHPSLSDDLPSSEYFLNLEDLLYFDIGYESLPMSHSKEIIEAGKSLDRIESKHDFDWDQPCADYMNALTKLETLENNALALQFMNEVIPSLPDDIKAKREEITRMILNLLEQCRKCVSWDERSEDKLARFIEDIPETMIRFTSLSNLVKIEDNLRFYLSIHKKEDQQ